MKLPLQRIKRIAQVARILGTVIVGLSATQTSIFAQWPTMRLDAWDVVGGQIGSTIELRVLAGSGCETADALISQFSASGLSGSDLSSSKLPFQLNTRPEIPAGSYPIRLRGRFGLSNSRNLWLTKEPWQAVLPDNTSPERAFAIGSGIIYSGRFEPRKEAYFQLKLPQKTRWRLECTTHALDSQAVVSLEVRDPVNEPVSFFQCRDSSERSITFDVQQSGLHLLKMSDHLYRGGSNFPYAIQLTQQSLELQTTSKFSASHPDFRTFTDPSQLLAAKIDTSRPILTHREQDFDDTHSMPIDLSTVVYGSFDHPRDTDTFEVFLEEGKSIAVDTLSNQIGQSTDLKIAVFPPSDFKGDTDSKVDKPQAIVDVDDQESLGTADLTLRSLDPCFLFTAKKEGLYRIVLYDQQRSTSEIYREANCKNYCLQLRNPQPDYDLLCYFAAPASKPEESNPVAPTLFKKQIGCLEVIAIRRDGFSNPIQIHIDQLPEGLSYKPIIMDANANQSSLMIDGTQIDSDQLVASLRISGKAILGNTAIQPDPLDKSSQSSMPDSQPDSKQDLPQDQRVAYAAEISHGPLSTRPVPLARLIPDLSLATSTAYTVPIAIHISVENEKISNASSIRLPIPTGQEKKQDPQKLKLLVRVARGQGADKPVIIHGFHLPKGVSLSELTIQSDRSEGELELTIEDSATLANFELIVVGETKLQAIDGKELNVQLWSLPRTIEVDNKVRQPF